MSEEEEASLFAELPPELFGRLEVSVRYVQSVGRTNLCVDGLTREGMVGLSHSMMLEPGQALEVAEFVADAFRHVIHNVDVTVNPYVVPDPVGWVIKTIDPFEDDTWLAWDQAGYPYLTSSLAAARIFQTNQAALDVFSMVSRVLKGKGLEVRPLFLWS